MTFFPKQRNLIIRPKGKKATNYLRSVFIGVFYPFFTLPYNLLTMVFWPAAAGVLMGLTRSFGLTYGFFHSAYMGLAGRIQVIADVDGFDYQIVQHLSVMMGDENKVVLDDVLEKSGAYV